MSEVHLITHPLVQHKLTLMRQKNTSTMKFRNLMREVSMLLGYEVTREMPMTMTSIETPIASMKSPLLAKKKMALVSILRAGNGILDGILQLLPSARVGHIGLYRDEGSGGVVEYYFKMPDDIASRDVLLLDPMLATGHTAVAAVSRLKQEGPKTIKFVCILAAPQGVEALRKHHPDVDIYTVAVDASLDDQGYIVPGMGDAGDRLFGTK
jgi:uracil phosphoribosyltransferase